jgi:hypothetical protein
MCQRNLVPLFQFLGLYKIRDLNTQKASIKNLTLCVSFTLWNIYTFLVTHCETFLSCVQQRKQKKYRRHRTTSTTTTELGPEVGDDVPETGDGEKDMYSMLENDEEAEEGKKKKKVIEEEEEDQEAKDEPPKETFKGNEIPFHSMSSVLCT